MSAIQDKTKRMNQTAANNVLYLQYKRAIQNYLDAFVAIEDIMQVIASIWNVCQILSCFMQIRAV